MRIKRKLTSLVAASVGLMLTHSPTWLLDRHSKAATCEMGDQHGSGSPRKGGGAAATSIPRSLPKEHIYAGRSTNQWRSEIQKWLTEVDRIFAKEMAKARAEKRRLPIPLLAKYPDEPLLVSAATVKHDPAATLVVLDFLRDDEPKEIREEAATILNGYITGGSCVNRGRCLKVNCNGVGYIVVVLRGEDQGKDSGGYTHDAHFLLLFDAGGRLLDQLSCAIDPELNGWWTDENFRADLLPEGEGDGARLVLRYLGLEPCIYHNVRPPHYGHSIVYEGKRRNFLWKVRVVEPRSRVTKADLLERVKKELCRVAIKDGKFVVTLPGPDAPTKDF
jgi:hypothetical protein